MPSKAASSSAASFIAAHHPQKPSARAQTQTNGKKWTISVAIPGSIVMNAQTPELRAWLAGQIARTCAIFSVSEIVVYKDAATATQPVFKPRGKYRDPVGGNDALGGGGGGGKEHYQEEDPSVFLARILEYLETPQYLRKALFPLHPSLRLAGLLPPLDCPHHLRRDDASPFREGITVAGSPNGKHHPSERSLKRRKTNGVMVDIGLWDPIEVECDTEVEQATRVTVRMPTSESQVASLISPSQPTSESGLYWGYKVRTAESLAAVLSESPYGSKGYDVIIGTSERGSPVEEMIPELPPFVHLLLALGPLSGLELTISADPLIPLEADEASDLFDFWINVVEGQGSRTVRTEEALPIALARLKTVFERQGAAGTV